MRLRHETQRQSIARMLLLGWTAERIARRLDCTSRAVRYAISTPEFQTMFETRRREHFATLDRRASRLLYAAVKALFRMLRHPDWRARDAAIEKILKIHGRYVEKLDLPGQLTHAGTIQHAHEHRLGILSEEDMDAETRTKARELLVLVRER